MSGSKTVAMTLGDTAAARALSARPAIRQRRDRT